MSYDPGFPLTEEDKKAVIRAFEKCAGYIRSEIGKAVKVRYVPELIFKLDGSFEYGAKMDRILDELKKEENNDGIQTSFGDHLQK